MGERSTSNFLGQNSFLERLMQALVSLDQHVEVVQPAQHTWNPALPLPYKTCKP